MPSLRTGPEGVRRSRPLRVSPAGIVRLGGAATTPPPPPPPSGESVATLAALTALDVPAGTVRRVDATGADYQLFDARPEWLGGYDVIDQAYVLVPDADRASESAPLASPDGALSHGDVVLGTLRLTSSDGREVLDWHLHGGSLAYGVNVIPGGGLEPDAVAAGRAPYEPATGRIEDWGGSPGKLGRHLFSDARTVTATYDRATTTRRWVRLNVTGIDPYELPGCKSWAEDDTFNSQHWFNWGQVLAERHPLKTFRFSRTMGYVGTLVFRSGVHTVGQPDDGRADPWDLRCLGGDRLYAYALDGAPVTVESALEMTKPALTSQSDYRGGAFTGLWHEGNARNNAAIWTNGAAYPKITVTSFRDGAHHCGIDFGNSGGKTVTLGARYEVRWRGRNRFRDFHGHGYHEGAINRVEADFDYSEDNYLEIYSPGGFRDFVHAVYEITSKYIPLLVVGGHSADCVLPHGANIGRLVYRDPEPKPAYHSGWPTTVIQGRGHRWQGPSPVRTPHRFEGDVRFNGIVSLFSSSGDLYDALGKGGWVTVDEEFNVVSGHDADGVIGPAPEHLAQHGRFEVRRTTARGAGLIRVGIGTQGLGQSLTFRHIDVVAEPGVADPGAGSAGARLRMNRPSVQTTVIDDCSLPDPTSTGVVMAPEGGAGMDTIVLGGRLTPFSRTPVSQGQDGGGGGGVLDVAQLRRQRFVAQDAHITFPQGSGDNSEVWDAVARLRGCYDLAAGLTSEEVGTAPTPAQGATEVPIQTALGWAPRECLWTVQTDSATPLAVDSWRYTGEFGTVYGPRGADLPFGVDFRSGTLVAVLSRAVEAGETVTLGYDARITPDSEWTFVRPHVSGRLLHRVGEGAAGTLDLSQHVEHRDVWGNAGGQTMTYEVATAPNGAVATASIVGGSGLRVDPVALGLTEVGVIARDEAGTETLVTVDVAVVEAAVPAPDAIPGLVRAWSGHDRAWADAAETVPAGFGDEVLSWAPAFGQAGSYVEIAGRTPPTRVPGGLLVGPGGRLAAPAETAVDGLTFLVAFRRDDISVDAYPVASRIEYDELGTNLRVKHDEVDWFSPSPSFRLDPGKVIPRSRDNIVTATVENGAQTIRLNGVQIGADTDPTDAGAYRIDLGAGTAPCEVAALAVYGRALTPSECRDVERWAAVELGAVLDPEPAS